jgi:hypothetical protein
MFLKKYLPYFCVLLCHKYALTFIKLQGKNENISKIKVVPLGERTRVSEEDKK